MKTILGDKKQFLWKGKLDGGRVCLIWHKVPSVSDKHYLTLALLGPSQCKHFYYVIDVDRRLPWFRLKYHTLICVKWNVGIFLLQSFIFLTSVPNSRNFGIGGGSEKRCWYSHHEGIANIFVELRGEVLIFKDFFCRWKLSYGVWEKDRLGVHLTLIIASFSLE